MNPAAGFVHKGDAVTDYKWLINEDDTGDPGTADATRAPTSACRATAPGGSTDPDYADTCQWPSIRNDLRLRADRRAGRPDRPQRHQGARQPARPAST